MNASGRIVALYGGSFDPPHIAHLLAGAYVLATHPVDLWLLPCAQHPFAKRMAPFEERAAMCRLVAEALGPRASVNPVEAELARDGTPSYTIDTVLHLRRAHPELSFRLVVGADILHERHKWKRWDDLVELAPPILLGRQGVTPPPGFELDVTLPRVSSTEVRRRLTTGERLEHLVPLTVLEHARRCGAYDHE